MTDPKHSLPNKINPTESNNQLIWTTLSRFGFLKSRARI